MILPSPREIFLADSIISRLDKRISKLELESAYEGEIRFYKGFQANVIRIRDGQVGDFIELMNYQLTDSWEYTKDRVLDAEVQELVHGLMRFFPKDR